MKKIRFKYYPEFVALVDDDDYCRVKKYKWYLMIENPQRGGRGRALYVRRYDYAGGQRTQTLHHFVLNQKQILNFLYQ